MPTPLTAAQQACLDQIFTQFKTTIPNAQATYTSASSALATAISNTNAAFNTASTQLGVATSSTDATLVTDVQLYRDALSAQKVAQANYDAAMAALSTAQAAGQALLTQFKGLAP